MQPATAPPASAVARAPAYRRLTLTILSLDVAIVAAELRARRLQALRVPQPVARPARGAA